VTDDKDNVDEVYCILLLCGAWSLTLREERMLWEFEVRVLWRIFEPERDETSGEWRKLHNKERNDIYSTPNVILVIKSRRMRWAGLVVVMGEKRRACRVMVEKPD
jgi:hypothetical protein